VLVPEGSFDMLTAIQSASEVRSAANRPLQLRCRLQSIVVTRPMQFAAKHSPISREATMSHRMDDVKA
jgi:hypothetical protein